MRFVLLSLWFVVSSVWAAPVDFEDKSTELGFTRGSETWGTAWGLLNNDKYPDIYNQGHRLFPRIYRNTGSGGFDDVAMEYDVRMNGWHIGDTQRDAHGGAFADFDNDGDQDYITGRKGDMYINEASIGGTLVRAPIASQFQFAAWDNTDADRDLESVVNCNGVVNTRQQYVLIFDIDVDGTADRICGTEGTFPIDDPTGLTPSISQSNDIALGDFNNDLRTDIIVTRGSTRPTGAAKVSSNRIEGWFRNVSGPYFTFSAPGAVKFILDGAGGGVFRDANIFDLDTAGTTDASGKGLQVSYDAATQLWRVEDIHNTTQSYVRIIAENPVSDPVMGGLEAGDTPKETFHGLNLPGGIQWVSNTGLSVPKHCVSVVAADFDNDMDLDLYMACRYGASNLANRYYDNQGDGTFVEVSSHGGEGPVGPGVEFGLSDSVTTGDYDLDGFVDLMVTNGLLYYPVGFGGPDTLLRNQGNGNHWIEMDLLGTISPNDAIGAKVYVTAGGVTQLREQSHGYHRWSQNHQRIHVGLGSNTLIDEVRIEWPSGQVDVFTNLTVDALYDVTEGGTMSVVPVSAYGAPIELTITGDENCGQPPYDSTLGPVMQLWRDCGTDMWHFRARGGLDRLTEDKVHAARGVLLGDQSFASVSAVNTSAGDTVSGPGSAQVGFDIAVQQAIGNNKGFDFDLTGFSNACFALTGTDFEAIYVGAAGKKIDPPFDLLAGTSGCDHDGDGDGIDDASDLDHDNDGLPTTVEGTTIDSDGDGVVDQLDLDSDGDAIPDVIEAGLADVDNNWLVDSLNQQGSVITPPDSDNDGIPDYLDLESNNPANNGTQFDIASTVFAALDTNGDGLVSSLDTGGGIDADADGIDDLIDGNPAGPGNGIGGGNTAPVVSDRLLSTLIDTPLGITLTGFDAESDPLTFSIDTYPVSGLLTGTPPAVTYTPNNGFVGTDSLQYSAFDGLSNSNQGTVTLSVSSTSTVFCGEPTYDNNVDRATFLWRDCATGVWSLRIMGGQSPTRVDFEGELFSIGGVNNLTPVLVEPNDLLDDSVLNKVIYRLSVYGNGVDGFDFEIPGDACYTPDPSYPVLFGTARVEMITDDVSLLTGATCPIAVDTDGDGLTDQEEAALGTNPNLADTDMGGVDDGDEVANNTNPLDAADDVVLSDACGEPMFDSSAEPGLYGWQDCGAGGSAAQWSFRAVGGGLSWSPYTGSLISDTAFTGSPIDLEGHDTFELAPNAQGLNFQLIIAGSGVEGFDVSVPAASQTCLDTVQVPAGASVFVGSNKTLKSQAFNLEDLGACNVTPPSPDPQCGTPDYDPATQPGIYLWQDCSNTAQRDWSVRIVAGGVSWQEFAGELTADAVLTPTGFSLEGNDTLDSVPGDGFVDFSLFVGGAGQDGLDVSLPSTATSCFDATVLPAGVQVFVGEGKLVQSGRFNLEDLAVCP